MKFDHPNLISPFSLCETSFLKYLVGAVFRHGVAHDIHCAAFESWGIISGQRLGYYFNGLVFESMSMNEVLGCNNTTCSSILLVKVKALVLLKIWQVPTDVGLHINLVSVLVIIGAFMTCSTLHPSRNWEYGLFTECLWFLDAVVRLCSKWSVHSCRVNIPILARCSIPPPYLAKYSRAPLSNIRGAPGPWFSPRPSCSISALLIFRSKVGGARSGKLVPRLPGFIRSKPSASAHSTSPYLTALLAWYKAAEPVEQLLFTLTMGMPVNPRLYRARYEEYHSVPGM